MMVTGWGCGVCVCGPSTRWMLHNSEAIIFCASEEKDRRESERRREKRNLGINVSPEKIFNFPSGVFFFLIIQHVLRPP